MKYIQLLLEHDTSSLNNREPKIGLAPLHRAALQGQEKCMQILIKNGADINLTTKNKNTLLHLAAQKNHSGLLRSLIPLLKPHINATNAYGFSPLMLAIKKQHPACAELLIKNGADVRTKDTFNQTALHFAASKNLPTIILLLLKYGADINYATPANCLITHAPCDNTINYGLYTPLHYAALCNNAHAMDILLQQGADATLRTQTGNTAFKILVEQLKKKQTL